MTPKPTDANPWASILWGDSMRSFRHPCLDTLVLAVILTAISLAGCKPGPAIGEVRGKVTYKGKPVSEGTITFINPSGGGSGDAQLGPDGSYEIKGGLVVGDYIVIVTPLIHYVDTDPGKTPPSPEEKPAPNIPRKYRAQASSPLKATVKEGPNTFNFDMDTKP